VSPPILWHEVLELVLLEREVCKRRCCFVSFYLKSMFERCDLPVHTIFIGYNLATLEQSFKHASFSVGRKFYL